MRVPLLDPQAPWSTALRKGSEGGTFRPERNPLGLPLRQVTGQKLRLMNGLEKLRDTEAGIEVQRAPANPRCIFCPPPPPAHSGHPPEMGRRRQGRRGMAGQR